MRQLLWIGILFLSASWLFFIPQFTLPDMVVGSLFIILGILCIIGGLWRIAPKQFETKYLFLLIPLILALLFVPFPYNIGLVVLTIGLLLSVILSKMNIVQGISFGFALAGIILIIQTTVFPLYVTFVSHGHQIDILSPVVSFVGSFLGLHTSTSNGIIFIQTVQHTYPITTTWEKLGCYLWLNIMLGSFLLLFLCYNRRKMLLNVIIFLITSIIYGILRYIAFLYGYVTTAELSLFWDPFILTVSFLPFILLMMKLLPLNDVKEDALQLPMFHVDKQFIVAFLLLFLLVFSFVGACLFQDPGELKNGRVLIDEYHSQWEDTTRPLDTEWYGLLSTYNYYSWAQWLSFYYDVKKNINNILTEELLNDYDILILKCPTESYTIQEIESIKHFVDTGGGLYLIGDHTNVFGMNTFLNQMAEEFGIRYKTDATYELGTGNLSRYEPDRLISHPVVQHVTQFDFMTSCTLEPTSFLASMRLENIIIGNRVISEPGTYATENFFRESVASPDSEYGYLLQAAAIKYGSGRVVFFTDSTVFSSFCLFTDGYPSFTLGTLGYLNRTNSLASLNLVFLVISVIVVIPLIVLLKNFKRIKILWMFFCAGLLAFSTIVPLCYSLNTLSYQLPNATTDYLRVCFEQQHSSLTISLKPTATLGSDKNNFGTFFVWTQRIGYVPSLETTLTDATTKGDVVVIINPTYSFSETDVQILTTYLENGGRVLLMDSIMNQKSTANELIGNFGLWITTNTKDESVNDTRVDNESYSINGTIAIPYLTVNGGVQLLDNLKNETYACLIEFSNKTTGKIGRLVVIVDAYTFSDALMGGTFTEPTEQQRHIYNTQFFLLDTILKP